jgi:cysteine synthase
LLYLLFFNSIHILQWFGMGVSSVAACTLTVAITDEPAPKTVKNLLKTSGALWGIAAAQTLYNAENGWQKKDLAYVTAAGQAVLGALSLWRGYCEEDE